MGYAQLLCRRPAGQFAPAPCGHDRRIVFAPFLELPPEVDASGLRRRDSLGLPLAVELPLRLRHITQEL